MDGWVEQGTFVNGDDPQIAVGETVSWWHPPVTLLGVSIWINRGCQQNDSLVNGYPQTTTPTTTHTHTPPPPPPPPPPPTPCPQDALPLLVQVLLLLPAVAAARVFANGHFSPTATEKR